jgi:hypothetical protein
MEVGRSFRKKYFLARKEDFQDRKTIFLSISNDFTLDQGHERFGDCLVTELCCLAIVVGYYTRSLER